MENIDQHLFYFFYDMKNILAYEDITHSGNLHKMHIQAEQYLKDKSYSNINMQDDGGNTLLHYAVKHCNLKYVSLLLEFGADPSITNNDGVSSFMQKNSQYDFIYKFWQNYDNIRGNNFAKTTENYSLNFKQDVLEYLLKKTKIHLPLLKIMPFLEEIKLYNITNIINLTLKTCETNTDNKLSYLLPLERTRENNSLILFHIGNKLATFETTHGQELFLDFINNSLFDNNLNFLDFLESGKYVRNYEKNSFSKNVINLLINKIINDNMDINHNINSTPASPYLKLNSNISTILQQFGFLNAIYLEKKLELDIPVNQSKSVIKKI